MGIGYGLNVILATYLYHLNILNLFNGVPVASTFENTICNVFREMWLSKLAKKQVL